MSSAESHEQSTEKADLLEALGRHRQLLRQTVRDLSDDRARERSTVSQLCLGGIVKHVTWAERAWTDFIVEGPSAMGTGDAASRERFAATFVMGPEETLAGLLEDYDQVAAATEELVRSLPSLDAVQPLPAAPWYPPGATRSARRVLLHVIAETSQHAGHADIIREAIDGAKTMG
jgi:uncharacterized damage-inducible protein DinB